MYIYIYEYPCESLWVLLKGSAAMHLIWQELLTKTAAAEEGSIATKSTADTEAVPDSRAEADKRKTGRIDSPSRMEPASGSYDKAGQGSIGNSR